MSQIEIRIVKLAPMRAASVLGFGESPEQESWRKIFAFARENGMLDQLHQHRFFGFNNPNPSPGSPNYGYEQWITLSPQHQPRGEAELIDFAGGLYAVARARGIPAIGPTWQKLVRWRKDSSFQAGPHQWLEECLNPARAFAGLDDLADPGSAVFAELELGLYLPIND